MNYNTLEGVKLSLASLKDFNDLVNERHKAGYKRKEHLNQFMVMGIWFLDSCGNCGRIQTDCESLKKFPVIDVDDYHARPQLYGADENTRLEIRFGGNSSSLVPYDRTCPVCKLGWDINNHMTAERESHFISKGKDAFSLEKFIGKKYSEVMDFYNQQGTEKHYFLSAIKQSDKWNDRGTKTGKLEDLIVCNGDDASISVDIFRHHLCVKADAYTKCQKHIASNGEAYSLPNLAGVHECDEYIKAELTMAQIPIVGVQSTGEVPYSFKGKLGDFTFYRAWAYWVVHGPVPLKIAEELYKNEVGKKYIRVSGDCTCPAPATWTESINGKKYVTSYHIDTLRGLQIFTDAIRNW